MSSPIGIALGLRDAWLSGHHRAAPINLGDRAALPAGQWNSERGTPVLPRPSAERSASALVSGSGSGDRLAVAEC